MPDHDTPLMNESTQAQAREKLDRAASTAHETVDRVHQRANEVTERVSSEADRYYQNATEWISSHPMQALLGAMFAGYLFGRMRR